jgi:hypothetical protein
MLKPHSVKCVLCSALPRRGVRKTVAHAGPGGIFSIQLSLDPNEQRASAALCQVDPV